MYHIKTQKVQIITNKFQKTVLNRYLDTWAALGWKQSCVTWSTGYIFTVVYRIEHLYGFMSALNSNNKRLRDHIAHLSNSASLRRNLSSFILVTSIKTKFKGNHKTFCLTIIISLESPSPEDALCQLFCNYLPCGRAWPFK